MVLTATQTLQNWRTVVYLSTKHASHACSHCISVFSFVTPPLFSAWTDIFYEQASSCTLWLKAFPCKPCKSCPPSVWQPGSCSTGKTGSSWSGGWHNHSEQHRLNWCVSEIECTDNGQERMYATCNQVTLLPTIGLSQTVSLQTGILYLSLTSSSTKHVVW